MSQITVDRVAVWDNVILLPPRAAAPAVRLIGSIRRRRPVWRRINAAPLQGYVDFRRIDEEPERWDGLS